MQNHYISFIFLSIISNQKITFLYTSVFNFPYVLKIQRYLSQKPNKIIPKRQGINLNQKKSADFPEEKFRYVLINFTLDFVYIKKLLP